MIRGINVDHNIGLPETYMEELGRVYQGVQFPDGRYFASLMVYHHLHCLVRTRPMLLSCQHTNKADINASVEAHLPRPAS